MITTPNDVRAAMQICNTAKDVGNALEDEALLDGILPMQINQCKTTGVQMVLTNEQPWWMILCTGNPVLAESRLRDAGYPKAFAGAPGKIWLRIATDAERQKYESETEA